MHVPSHLMNLSDVSLVIILSSLWYRMGLAAVSELSVTLNALDLLLNADPNIIKNADIFRWS